MENEMKPCDYNNTGAQKAHEGICKKCTKALPENAAFCPWCGRAVDYIPHRKKRGNGQGSVYPTPNGRYRAIVTLGYFLDDDGVKHRRTRTQVFEKKKDAVAALPTLASDPRRREKAGITFGELYDKWLPTHRAGASTIGNYKAAFNHFEAVRHLRMTEIDVDDLQECIDDCGRGKRTQRNMKTVAGLVYKYGIPRKVVPDNLNLADFLTVGGESAAHRPSFTDIEIEKIRQAVGKVPHAEDIYCMIYTGFRPNEFLALTSESYDKARSCLTGGGKTAAGTNRVVTISPKIERLIARRSASQGYLFSDAGNKWELRDFTEKAFYPALEAIGIDNPIVEIGGGVKRHKYTPHSCRHTFATLLKRTPGADKDKLELIGHTSGEMLRYYQDTALNDLKQITNAM